jgi:small-conductance mechanosensitive channel
MIARLILVCFGTTVLLVAVRRMRSYRLKERHMLLFTFTGLPFLVLAIWPAAVGRAAQWLHVEYHTVSLLCIAAFLILMVFELLTIVSLQDRKIATLAQMVGILMEKQGMSEHSAGEGSAEKSYDLSARL